jgi:hypothetical protein
MTSPVVVWLVTTAGGVMFFVFLVRRSREEDDPWPNGLLLAAPPLGITAVPPARAPRPVASAASKTPSAVAAAPPRVATRKFDKKPRKGIERATVGYRGVRISSKPDTVHSFELGRLDRGDEVETLDSFEGFLQIRTPDGITGWILRHTIIGAPSEGAGPK